MNPTIECEISADSTRSDEQIEEIKHTHQRNTPPTLICESPEMLAVLEQIELFANSKAPVLVTGESGTGKEVVARLIHDKSARSKQHYVRVNCAALSETLIESELFGHEKGAFTGAVATRIGRLEWAGKGTVLLDEISEIAPPLQAKLLRVLEEEEFQRVGSNRSFPLAARVIATSNRSLIDEVRHGRFREDLFYRLNVLQVHVPPLRDRRSDIASLVRYFINCFQEEGRRRLESISPGAMDLLCHYDWPGNVRQLRNTVRRLCILSSESELSVELVNQLGQLVEPTDQSKMSQLWERPAERVFEMTLREVEQLLIRTAMKRFGGNQTAAAKHLGITSRTLHNHLKRDSDLQTRRAA